MDLSLFVWVLTPPPLLPDKTDYVLLLQERRGRAFHLPGGNRVMSSVIAEASGACMGPRPAPEQSEWCRAWQIIL